MIEKYFIYIKYGVIITILSATHYLFFDYGKRIEKEKHDQTILAYKNEIIEIKNKQLQEVEELNNKYNEASSQYQSDLVTLKQDTKVITKQVVKEVAKPIYTECKITDDAIKSHSELVDKLNEN